MTLYGYARVSTGDRDLSLQETSLRAARCQVIRSEKKSGTRRNGRTELDTLLQFLRAGDALVITRIDRLARSLTDLQDIVHAPPGLAACRAALGGRPSDILGILARDAQATRESIAAELRAARAEALGTPHGRRCAITD